MGLGAGWRQGGAWRAAAWAVVFLVSLGFYAAERSLEHFLWRLGYGAAAGMVAGSAWAAWQP